MNIDLTNIDGSVISTQRLTPGTVSTIQARNPEANAKSCKLFTTCVDDLVPANAINSQGAEIVSGSWVSARVSGDSTWVPLGTPTFGATFADISGNLLAFSLASHETKNIEVKIDKPDFPSSAGLVTYALRIMAHAG